MDNIPGQEQEARIFEAKRRAAEMVEFGLERVERVEQIVGVSLSAPAEKRDETQLPVGLVIGDAPSTEEQIRLDAIDREVRPLLAEVGVGMQRNLDVQAAGLPDDAAVEIEGGQPHKIQAEVEVALSKGSGPIILAGSQERAMGAGELVSLRVCVSRHAKQAPESVNVDEVATELDAGKFLLEHDSRFDMLQENARTLVAVIGVDGAVEPVDEAVRSMELSDDDPSVGFLMLAGTTTDAQGHRPVYTLNVPRQYQFHPDGSPVLNDRGQQMYIQPDAKVLMPAIAAAIDAQAVGVATSVTYLPSRMADAAVANYEEALQGGMTKYGVLAYSPQTLAAVKREDAPSAPSLAHILGEAYQFRAKLQDLRARIANGNL